MDVRRSRRPDSPPRRAALRLAYTRPMVDAMRVGWLTLCLMMLLSRVIFQAGGATSMRAFLDDWKQSNTKRVWGAISLTFAAVLMALAVGDLDDLGGMDVVLTVALLAVLIAEVVASRRIEPGLVVLAVVLAAAATASLIGALKWETRRSKLVQ